MITFLKKNYRWIKIIIYNFDESIPIYIERVGSGLSKIIFSQPLILQVPLKLMYAKILPLPMLDLRIVTQNIRWTGTFFYQNLIYNN